MHTDSRPEAGLWLVTYHLSLITVSPQAERPFTNSQFKGPCGKPPQGHGRPPERIFSQTRIPGMHTDLHVQESIINIDYQWAILLA